MNEKLYSFQHHTQAPATSSNDLNNTLPLIMYKSSDPALLNLQTCISCLSCDISSPDPPGSRIKYWYSGDYGMLKYLMTCILSCSC